MSRPSLTRAHRALLGVVAAGACLISGIGFAGSYNAVRELAMEKGFGAFSYAFPIGVDAGIVVLLSLDLVLTWLRIPFPLLRQTAWLLTAATIAFNAAASWGDALGMAMHAVIPVLFVVVVEASRHAVGRIAAITADRHMESVRLMRWLLSPVPTFRLWRRMKLWELRSYDETVRLEQNRLVYRAQLRFRYGRGWRRSAPFQALLPLKLAKYGVPLDPSILDRIDGPLAVTQDGQPVPSASTSAAAVVSAPVSAAVAVPTLAKLAAVRLRDAQEPGQGDEAQAPTQTELNVWTERAVRSHAQQAEAAYTARVPGQMSPWFKPPRVSRPTAAGPVPVAPVRVAPAQVGPRPVRLEQLAPQAVDAPRSAGRQPGPNGQPVAARQSTGQRSEAQSARVEAEPLPFDDTDEIGDEAANGAHTTNGAYRESAAFHGADRQEGGADQDRRLAVEPLDPDQCFDALIDYIDQYGHQPEPQRFAEYLTKEYGLTGTRPDGSVGPAELNRIWPGLQDRYVASGRD
ncbi:hypothetical protein GCM10010193_66790 [Kitasatospora atroaurantiaca]|uniref:Uncharacterized protein DUF2637 n=1 Tax=Kitasatospora atroaurantiaca TaxID=285545 RepID=A0A561EW27_9ACTN|nr:DUF2637 domain-containing protein [Kitasatospora atroaurantiaca]TWE19771.1 uncharacterized protein DUF2637 [Kitasatospora atroaurantiaca]